MMATRVRVQEEDFDVAAEIAALHGSDKRVGAIALFLGTVRDINEIASENANSENANEKINVETMTLEHYPGMTEKSLTRIVEEAQRRFPIYGATVIHRIGALQPLDQIVLVAVKSAHRGDAFDACRFIIDYLKTEAPFWKKEKTPQGERWVDARESDGRARQRWAQSGDSSVSGSDDELDR